LSLPPPWIEWSGEPPLVAVALHHGHDLRDEVAAHMALDDEARRREEDPGTALWATIAATGFVVSRSRFEVDLNRPLERAVYRTPAECWGLEAWRGPLPEDLVARSLELHRSFYGAIEASLERLLARHRRVVVLDLHSYNHRRGGPEAPPEAPADNPDWNVGTGTVDRDVFGPLVERFLRELRSWRRRDGRSFDVRENVRFRGGFFPTWLHQRFPGRVCALAVECKKFFMDEWTGGSTFASLEEPRLVLAAAVPALLAELERP
jgi:N-formylglutamate amidohydrolase